MQDLYLVNPENLSLFVMNNLDSKALDSWKKHFAERGWDTFNTHVEALTAIELCRDQHRKNQKDRSNP